MPEEGNREMMGQWRGAPMGALATLQRVDLAQGTFAAAAATAWHQPSLPFLLGAPPARPGGSPALPPSPSRTGCPEPGLEQKMVYFLMMPLGLAGGSQDTTTLLAEDGTALMPAGGPGTEGGRAWRSWRRELSEASAQPGEAAAPRRSAGVPWSGDAVSSGGQGCERGEVCSPAVPPLSPHCLRDTAPRVAPAPCPARGSRVNCSPGSG